MISLHLIIKQYSVVLCGWIRSPQCHCWLRSAQSKFGGFQPSDDAVTRLPDATPLKLCSHLAASIQHIFPCCCIDSLTCRFLCEREGRGETRPLSGSARLRRRSATDPPPSAVVCLRVAVPPRSSGRTANSSLREQPDDGQSARGGEASGGGEELR